MYSKPKILVVNDNINNICILEELLSEMEIELVRALSGIEAIEQTRQQEFALVLMDVQMSGMDGFETVEAIRKNPGNELLPIIYITSDYHENYYRVKGIKNGAVDFVTKPIFADVLIGKVNIFVNLYRHRKKLETEIARRAEVEKELKAAKEIAEDAAHAKQQFLSTMSHEIRTPLNAIINTVNLLKEENPPKEQMENLDILQFSADNLLRIVNDILDFSKIDAGKIEFERIDFELRKLLSGIKQSFDYELVRKGLEMEILVDETIPYVIQGDSVKLSQILINLVGNAVKFTQKGKITVIAETYLFEDKMVGIQFRIVDTGIGISTEKLDYVFESFTQESSSTTRKYGGTGLGLAITKKLVELQDGNIRVDSNEGFGSTFTVTLKFTISDKTHIEEDMLQKTTFHSLKGLKILVVEDNLVNQKIVTKYLTKWEATVELAENGKVAIEKVQQIMYDLILMDLHMPVMNGYEATMKIRSLDNNYYKELPIIALTASAFMDEREKIFSYGMSGYIIKPFNPTELFWKISPFLTKR